MPSQIELSELIGQVADQLRQVRASEPQDPVMKFSEATIELGVIIEREAKGGIKIWVAELGGGKTKTDTATVSVKFDALGDIRTIAAVSLDPGNSPHDDAAKWSAEHPAESVERPPRKRDK